MARTGLIYGPTGARKTTAVAHFAHYIAEVTGKATLLLSADGGGWSPAGPEIKVGMIVPWRLETDVLPLPLLRKASQGLMPTDPEEMRPDKINLQPIDWNKFGGIAVEGWTSIGRVIMRYLPDKGVNVGGEDRSKLGTFSVPVIVGGTVVQERFSSNTRGDYGFVQNVLSGLVMNWASLPCHYVLFTALEAKGRDDDGTTIYGPGIPGKAVIADSAQWVGDCLHAQDYPIVRTVKVPDPTDSTKQVDSTVVDTAVRFHYMSHPDPQTGIIFKCKPRCAPTQIPKLYEKWPGGYFEPGLRAGFDTYLNLMDELEGNGAEDESLKAWRDKQDARRAGRVASVAATTQVK